MVSVLAVGLATPPLAGYPVDPTPGQHSGPVVSRTPEAQVPTAVLPIVAGERRCLIGKRSHRGHDHDDADNEDGFPPSGAVSRMRSRAPYKRASTDGVR